MGTLTLPVNGVVYLEVAPIIYSVEKHADYWALIEPIWLALRNKEIIVVTSELTLLETLVAPLKNNNFALVAAYENLLTKTEVAVLPITIQILREAANLRAQLNLKTPDSIHAATALIHGCDLFITNDAGLRRVSKLNVEVLKDLI